MEDRKTSWIYNLMNVTTDRSGQRPYVQKPNAHELVGVNGQLAGGMSPFPGFLKAYEFSPTTGVPSNTIGNQMSWSGKNVLEFFPFDCKVGTNEYAFGVVYRVGGSSGLCDVLVDFVRVTGGAGSWNRNRLLMYNKPRPLSSDNVSGAQMSISVWGRFVYVFMTDQEPICFQIVTSGAAGIEVLTDTGPGKRPTLLSASQSVPLGTIPAPSTGRPGAGQIFLTEFFPDEITTLSGIATSASFDSDDIGRDEVTSLQPGSYAFAYVLYNSQNGRRSALSEIAYGKSADFDPDGSGPLAAVPLHAAIEIHYDKTKYDQAYIYRSVRVEAAGGTYVAGLLHLDNIITLANFQIGTATATHATAVYFYGLDDRQLVRQDTFIDNVMFDEEMPKAGCAAMYENTLMCSNIKTSTVSSSEFNRPDDALKGLGELRWSSASEICPELFSPQSKYLPKIPNNKIFAFEQVGPNLLGFSLDRVYLIRKEAGISIYELHAGYGIVNPNASETVGTICYFMTSKGLKAIDVQSQLDDVKSLNELIISHWSSNLEQLSMAFDPIMSALFILNPTTKETYILWFNTAMVTSLIDTDFAFCKKGSWPTNWPVWGDTASGADFAQPLVERCLFVRNPSNATPALYFTDYKDELTQTTGSYVGSKRCTLMPLKHDSVFVMDAAKSSGSPNLDLTNTPDSSSLLSGYQVYVMKSANRTLIGKKATIKTTTTSRIVLDSDHTNLNGLAKGDIIGVSPVVMRWVGYPASLASDEMAQQDESLNMFRVKHFDSLALSMTDVVNPRANMVEGVVKSLAYRGNDDDPAATGYSLDTSGALENALSNYEGVYYAAFESPNTATTTQPKYGVDGSCLTPGFQIVYPDATFSVIGANVTGSIRASLRTRRPV